MTVPRIWDVHVHFPRPFPGPPGQRPPGATPVSDPRDPAAAAGRTPQEMVDHLAEKLREVGVVKASLLCGGRFGLTYEQSIEMAQKHEDLFVPHAVVDPEDTTYERIHQLNRLGYRGLKIIGTRKAYDSRDYSPVYRAAEELDMPVLFHCGVIGGGMDLLARHPRRDPESAKRMREMEAQTARARAEAEEAARKAHPLPPPEPQGPMAALRRMGPRETSATYMRPFHLETIANRFPRLKVIGAHMGGTGNYDEAASVARWRRWVYFDLSGGRTIERHAVERGLIGKEIPLEKLIFGSDCGADEVHEHVERFVQIFDDLGLSDEEKDLLWYRNAAEMFGVEEPSWAKE
jgi:predicted TIM-barrel fold metal-dependent hydrolase